MKRTIKNIQLEACIGIINDPNSFRNNVAIKIPRTLDHALRVNIKAMNDRYTVFNEMLNELQMEYVKAGKINEDGTRISAEYLEEYNKEYVPLAIQENDIDFQPIRVEDFDHLMLSMPERDLLMLMTDESENTN